MFHVIVSLLMTLRSTSALSDLSDLPGRYCEGRLPSCCTSRQDDCSVPIVDTLCYCDEFCAREVNDDCCPDYPHVCLNHTKPTAPSPVTVPSCWHDGVSYPQGSTVRINCNECECKRVCEGRSCMDFVCTQNTCLVDPEVLIRVNGNRSVGWKAANYSDFWGRTLDEGFAYRLGTRHSKKRAYTMRAINEMFDRARVRSKQRYDLRTAYPGLVSAPLDQGWCAVDWAVSTVQVATDRLAIVSRGEDRAALSPQHLLSCNSKNQRGCDGGHITRAWKFIQKNGLVPEACFPWIGKQTTCTIPKIKDKSRTTSRCANGNDVMSLHRTGPIYRVSKDPENIMYEILTSGPVQATMRVSQDFFSYRNGVYQCGEFRKNAYHAVRIIGWDEEIIEGKRVEYWIVSNSWGTWWGEGGYFRVRRGENDCEIESLVVAAWINPILPKKDPSITIDDANLLSNAIP